MRLATLVMRGPSQAGALQVTVQLEVGRGNPMRAVRQLQGVRRRGSKRSKRSKRRRGSKRKVPTIGQQIL
jgi:hypothetical protein